jgi:predicted nuclease with TOPRIM domain
MLQQKGSYQLESLVCRVSDLEETVERKEEESDMQLKASYQNSSAAWEVIEALQERVKTLETYCSLYQEQMAATRGELKELYNRQLELMDGEESLEERVHRLEDPGDILPSFSTTNMGSLRMDKR